MMARAQSSRKFSSLLRRKKIFLCPNFNKTSHRVNSASMTPEQHLAATDSRMAALIARSLRYNIKSPVSTRPFDALAESIAYQQLSGKAAATIWSRVRALYPKGKRLDPQKILATPDDTFRAAGLSRAKIAALKDLAAKTIDGTVPSARALSQMSDDEIVARLIE